MYETGKVSICIPLRSDGGWRDEVARWVVSRWNECFRSLEWDHEISVADSDSLLPFNRSQARNNAVKGSSGEILILADADTTIPSWFHLGMNISMMESYPWILSARYVCVDERCTRQIVAGPTDELIDDVAVESELGTSPGGIAVIPREGFDAAGGYDENFQGWGFEDDAFRTAADTLWGNHLRSGEVLHLWHPRTPAENFEQPHIHDNQHRWLAYEHSRGNQQAMRYVVEGRSE